MKKNRGTVLGSIIVLILIICNFYSTANIAADVIKSEEVTNKSFDATGFFRVENISGVWWFVTPEGDKFYSIAGGWAPSIFFYGNESEWFELMSEKLRSWGFNTFKESQYYYLRASCHRFGEETGWPHGKIPDVFDPKWEEFVREKINSSANQPRDDPNLIGYQLGNEMKWGPDTFDERTILEVYLAA